MVFKGVSGNGADMLADWTHSGDFDNEDTAHLIQNKIHNYRENFIYNTWNTIGIRKVTILRKITNFYTN